ncbi:MAG TPA: hypothetical protein IAC48_08990 [Candidatus Limiplasma stercoravium]|nr:hypothetical protein [Candidatus Limiplasma stercoravium]
MDLHSTSPSVLWAQLIKAFFLGKRKGKNGIGDGKTLEIQGKTDACKAFMNEKRACVFLKENTRALSKG